MLHPVSRNNILMVIVQLFVHNTHVYDSLIFGWGLDVCIKLSLKVNDIASLLVAYSTAATNAEKFNTWAAFMEKNFSVCVCVCMCVCIDPCVDASNTVLLDSTSTSVNCKLGGGGGQ